MRLYAISIWGPCQNEGDVLVRRSHAPDRTAAVIAPSKSLANQVCYLAATQGVPGQFNYQEIDSFAFCCACVLDTAGDPITFESDIVAELVADPILPPLSVPDTQTTDGALFFARCIEVANATDKTGRTCGQFWVYAPDAASANIIATEHGDSMANFDLDENAMRVELFPMEKTCVFWNVGMILYELHNNTAGGGA